MSRILIRMMYVQLWKFVPPLYQNKVEILYKLHVMFSFISVYFFHPQNKFYFQYWTARKSLMFYAVRLMYFYLRSVQNTLRWWLTDTATTFRIRGTLPRVETLKFFDITLYTSPKFRAAKPAAGRKGKCNCRIETWPLQNGKCCHKKQRPFLWNMTHDKIGPCPRLIERKGGGETRCSTGNFISALLLNFAIKLFFVFLGPLGGF